MSDLLSRYRIFKVPNQITDTIYWGIDTSSNGLLTISSHPLSSSERAAHGGSFSGDAIFTTRSDNPWNPYLLNISRVFVKDRVVPKYCSRWFDSADYYTVEQHSLITVDLRNLDVSNCESFFAMFQYAMALTSILGLENFNTENVKNVTGIFSNCRSLQSLNVSSWDVSNLTSLSQFFADCRSLQSLNVSSWDVSNVTNLEYIFAGCTSLQSLNVSSWDVSNVTTLARSFLDCDSLQSLDLGSWDVSNVTDFTNTFLTGELVESNLRTLNLSNWNPIKATTFYQCFACFSSSRSKLETIYCNYSWPNLSGEATTRMFFNTPNLRGAISYDSNKTTAAYANPNTGYFTRWTE